MRTRRKAAFWIVAVLAVVVAGALIVPFLVPLDRFIPEVEKVAAEKLGVPVRVGELRLYLLPTPHGTATGIELGKGEVTVGKVKIVPELLSLFGATKVIRLVEVDKLFLRDSIFGKLKLDSGPSAGPKVVEIKRVVVVEMTPEMNGAALGSWRADIDLGGPIGVERANISSSDRKLVASLLPRGKEWDIDISAKDWQAPVGPPIRFTSLSARGTMTEKSLNLAEIKAALYGGTLTGAAKAEFPERWSVTGNFTAANVDVAALAKVFSPKQSLGGKLQADGKFSARASKPEGLADALGVDGKFAIANGVLHGFDLASAVTKMITGGTKGGETHFDHFTGNYQVAGKNVRLRNLAISSGILEAKGNVDITGGSKLSGLVEVEMKNTKGLVGVPVALSGTVKDPSLSPSKGLAIGAAVGTVLLPGVGTSLGASVGRFFEKKTSK